MVDLPGDIALRGGIFLGVLGTLMVLEVFLRGPNPPPMRGRRWPANAGLVLLDTVLARLLLPAGVVGAAAWAQAQGFGLLNQLAWPAWLEFGIALVLLDLAIYWQHRLLHAWPLLWRLHRVHHTDRTLDATSALRFHPLEMLLSLAIKIALAVLLGIPPVAAMVFEVLLSSFALVTHANLALPHWLDRPVRALLVTPNMHRIHHSTDVDEQHRNFGFNLSLWDHVFGSFVAHARSQPQDFGVDGVDMDEATGFVALLREPFVTRD
ncbi:sterol desaturase family protein [Thermomonas sp.]|uniref:sterol desaturase family protein n=1 Tax=Thermomonas sp. TaxID=1971895 RepID=UPI002489D731|nr:sterol desaturase family protein [Thermomonas sp.]MDI1254001.1 sterol desaturase family protein [Thermomonas sp.]